MMMTSTMPPATYATVPTLSPSLRCGSRTQGKFTEAAKLLEGGYPAFLEFIEQKEEEQANALIKGGKLVLRKAVSDGKKERVLVLVVSPASNLTNGLTSEFPL